MTTIQPAIGEPVVGPVPPASPALPSQVKAALAALATLAAAIITLLNVFSAVHWTAAQTALVTTEVGAVVGLLSAVVAHLWPGTAKEPVAIAATITALVSATIALGTGFAWWSWTQEQTTAVVGLVSAIIGVGGALFARNFTTAN
jgi:hypothetical protein